MEEDLKFRVWYDDDVYAIVDKISKKIKQFGLTIENIEGINDGFEDFEIKKIE